METQKLEREAINSWDFNHAARYCRRYLANRLHVIRSATSDEALAFTTAIIVTYSRPFSGNRDCAGKRDSVDERYISALSPSVQCVHDRIVNLRNSLFAHSDSLAHSVQVSHTTGGGLVTFSRDPLASLKEAEIVCLLAILRKFDDVNDELRRGAAAKHLSSRRAQ